MKKIFAIFVFMLFACHLWAQEVGKYQWNEPDTLKRQPFHIVEVMPSFPGGKDMLDNFIRERLYYPSSALAESVQGTVVYRFVITKNGNIEDIQLLRGIHPDCDDVVLNILRSMPPWNPGMQRGVPVDVYYHLPFRFRFSKEVRETKTVKDQPNYNYE